MINFNFTLRNPWSDRFTSLWCRMFKTPFRSKFIELETFRDSTFFTINFNWTVRQSHAGLDFELGVLGFCFHSNFYDSRHWDYENKKWLDYSNIEE